MVPRENKDNTYANLGRQTRTIMVLIFLKWPIKLAKTVP